MPVDGLSVPAGPPPRAATYSSPSLGPFFSLHTLPQFLCCRSVKLESRGSRALGLKVAGDLHLEPVLQLCPDYREGGSQKGCCFLLNGGDLSQQCPGHKVATWML